MAYLTLNGITIPTAKGGQCDIVEVGNRTRAFDGTYIRETRAYKRKWKFQTKPVSELRGMAIAGTIQGKGFYMPYNGDNYATNGFAPTGNINQRSSVAADGAPVYDENGVLEAKYGSYSVVGEGAPVGPVTNTNQTSTANAECSSIAGYGGIGSPTATISVDTAQKWQGTNSIKVVSTVTGGGIDGPIAGGSPFIGIATTLSVYLYSATNLAVTVVLYDNAHNTHFTTTAVTLIAGAWRRVAVTCTTTGLGIDWHLQIFTTSGAGTFWMDGVQAEMSPWPTSWLTPAASTRTATNLSYTTNFVGAEGLTVNFWMTKPYNTGANANFWGAGGASGTYIAIFAPSGTPNVLAVDTAILGGNYNRISATVSYTGWHMVTFVMRYTPETGESNKYLYFDGALVASASGISLPTGLTGWAPGEVFAAGYSYNRLSDMQVLPFAVGAPTVTGWYGAGGSPGATPFLTAAGDFVADSSVTVMGQVEHINTVGYFDSGNAVWRANGRVVEFTLEEV